MAERFGGKYSPDGTPPGTPAPAAPAFNGMRRSRAGGRVNLLFLLPLVFVITAFRQAPVGLTLDLAACATLLLAAWLTREGIYAHEAYDARNVARRPAMPRKLIASALTGIALFVGGFTTLGAVLNPVLFAILGAALHAFSFGPDPLRNKGMEGVDTFQTDRVARAVDEAEKLLAAMKDAILRAGDRALETRVERFQTTARSMFRTVEKDPGDLTAARKYLSVYLMGARDATIKFADFYAQGRDRQARTDYEALLDDLETHFAAETKTFLGNNRTDLSVEIDVLRERLQREGVKPE